MHQLSVKASNGEHIQMYAKTSILCKEWAGCYCNTFDLCQNVGIGLDDSWSALDARLNTKTVNLPKMQTEETMALTDTSETIKSSVETPEKILNVIKSFIAKGAVILYVRILHCTSFPFLHSS